MVDRGCCVSLKDCGCSEGDRDDEEVTFVLYYCLSNCSHAPLRPVLKLGENFESGICLAIAYPACPSYSVFVHSLIIER